ncbi:hypothetical protein UlMin_029823 [Ulmus minor]
MLSLQNPVSVTKKLNSELFVSRENNVFHKRKTQLSSPFSSSSCGVVFAVERESQEFEIDPDKARESLKELDQQFQSLSQKQVRSPKIKASDLNFTREQIISEEGLPELSGSFLAYSAIALVLFTIFYNVLFINVIKPSIDGPEEAPTMAVETQIQK